MPFPFKIRRRGRLYNVSSKNSFLVRVRLLDNTVIECTRPVESTGQEYLETVGEKLQLSETQYFGLWFKSKSQAQRWVELEKGLKKQLDKFAADHLLSFGVMFYMPSVLCLEQEVTRYQYYLQVKKDILDGRLRCSFEQGIRLAGLAVQADFGNVSRFESQDFLQEYALFPLGWTCADDEVLEKWTQKVAEEHKHHCGMTAAEAELLYVKEVEKLNNFGEESFLAKMDWLYIVQDSYANDVYLGASFIGPFVRHRNGKLIVLHRWNDVGNISHSRATVTVEVLSKASIISFQTDDMETAKYIARLLTSKHKFYEQNISAKLERSPVLMQRQTWSGSTGTRPPSYLKPLPAQHGEHYQDQSSEDSIPQDALHYSSETSLDQSLMARRGSVYSTPSSSSLNHLQTVMQASPVSSNLSIPGSTDIMRLDYIPRHRHSAIIVPSYRPTPDYDMAVQQQRLTKAAGCRSQSLRSLNISRSCAYRQREALVYSQPEMRERSSRFPGPWGSRMRYSMPATTTPFTYSSGPTNEPAGTISHTVSTPELADGEQPAAAGYSTAHMLKNQLSCPPPPCPVFRPTASTPDLAVHPYGYPGSSSPELGARTVRQRVGSFQPQSSVIRHSFRETEHLTMPALGEHSNLQAISSMVQNMEAMTLRSLNASIVRRNTHREEMSPSSPTNAPSPQHVRSPSDATMIIHSSESEKEDEETPDLCQQTQSFNQRSILAQLQAALGRIPNRPPPGYPGPGGMATPSVPQATEVAQASLRGEAQSHDSAVACAQQNQLSGSMLAPSVTEPGLTCVKEKVEKKVVKERPSSDMLSAEDSFVEGEIMQRMQEKQEMSKAASLVKRSPSGQNNPYAARFPISDSQRHGQTGIDEQRRLLERKLAEEERVAAEFVQIPWKASDRMVAAAAAATLLSGNTEWNRLPDVVPYEENRVMLVPTKENHTGYINASHIKVVIAGEEWHYIAAQGPLPNTFQDFWQMVWEQGVNVIAMVTAEKEGSRSQRNRYWPQLKQNLTVHGHFQVTTKFCTDFGCYASTGLTMKNLISGQERTLWHLQYTDWASNGCPRNRQDFLSYLEEMRSLRRGTNRVLGTCRSRTPTVVHCSTGAGQTGIVILTELMISCLEQSQNIDIPVMLARLRQQRMLLVQTFAQYKFVYQVLIHFLKNFRLI